VQRVHFKSYIYEYLASPTRERMNIFISFSAYFEQYTITVQTRKYIIYTIQYSRCCRFLYHKLLTTFYVYECFTFFGIQPLCGMQHCKKILRDSWIIFDHTFQGLGLGTLFPARESLVSDIPAGDGKLLNL